MQNTLRVNTFEKVYTAVVEAKRINPDRYKIIYNTNYDDNDRSDISNQDNKFIPPAKSPYPNYHYKVSV
jgi:hypothetical protein